MRTVRLIILVGSVLLFTNLARTPAPTAQVTNVNKVTPLILEKNEGERRVVRGWPGHPQLGETFILKVDPKNGGSSHLVFLRQRSRLREKYQPTSILVRTKSSFCRREPLACIWEMLLETYRLEPRFSYLPIHGLQSQISEVM